MLDRDAGGSTCVADFWEFRKDTFPDVSVLDRANRDVAIWSAAGSGDMRSKLVTSMVVGGEVLYRHCNWTFVWSLGCGFYHKYAARQWQGWSLGWLFCCVAGAYLSTPQYSITTQQKKRKSEPRGEQVSLHISWKWSEPGCQCLAYSITMAVRFGQSYSRGHTGGFQKGVGILSFVASQPVGTDKIVNYVMG